MPEKENIIGRVVRSDVEKIGEFHCSSELLNKFYNNIIWTEASNLYGLPTDCPQRDERLGWLNYMTVRNECALYNYRLSSLYKKWLGDIRDTQGEVIGLGHLVAQTKTVLVLERFHQLLLEY